MLVSVIPNFIKLFFKSVLVIGLICFQPLDMVISYYNDDWFLIMNNTFYTIKYKSPRNYCILPQINLKHNIAVRLSSAKVRCVEVQLSIVLERAGVGRVWSSHL